MRRTELLHDCRAQLRWIRRIDQQSQFAVEQSLAASVDLAADTGDTTGEGFTKGIVEVTPVCD